VSHSKSEKQRRDLINTMIDNLRTLVPSSLGDHGSNKPHDGPRELCATEGKRTKAAVLKQTYELIEFQNQRVRRLCSLPAHTAALATGGKWLHILPSVAGDPLPTPALVMT
jgi:hypothetical protein